MSVNKKFKFSNAVKQKGYLTIFCENVFNEYNYREEPAFKGMPERMAFEPEIWIVGAELMQKLKEAKENIKEYSLLLEEILKIIETEKYNSGRESFVMTLHFFKNNSTIEKVLISLLDDNQLYGFALQELNKLKLYCCTDKVAEILKNEKTGWIKKEAKRYIENSYK